MIKSCQSQKATVSVCEKPQFRQWFVLLSLTSSWWEILTFVCVCACVFVHVCLREKKKENSWEWVRVRTPTWLFASVRKLKREFVRWHLVSCLTFPVSQGSRFKNNAEEKPPTTDNRNATKKKKKALFVGDWIIAVAWDCRQGKCVSDCTLLVADTYHLPDSSSHSSPSTPHNSRNTLKKSESGGDAR